MLDEASVVDVEYLPGYDRTLAWRYDQVPAASDVFRNSEIENRGIKC